MIFGKVISSWIISLAVVAVGFVQVKLIRRCSRSRRHRRLQLWQLKLQNHFAEQQQRESRLALHHADYELGQAFQQLINQIKLPSPN